MNPYSPPKANVSNLNPVLTRRPGYVIGALALLQLVIFFLYFSVYFELVRNGSAAGTLGLGTLVSCLLLYVGSIRFLINPMKGKYFFLLAGIGLGLATVRWNLRYWWSYPFVLGCVIALTGWWFVRGNQAIPITRNND